MTQRPFAAFDIDGTVVRWQLYHAIVHELAKSGAIPADIAARIDTARQTWKKRAGGAESFSDYEHVLVHSYHEALHGLTESDFDQAVEVVFERYHQQTYVYTRDLIASLKKQGYLLFAISGSHQQIVKKFGEHYGFDDTIGVQYMIEDGRYTGERNSPVETGKALSLRELVEKHNASWANSIAIGDSHSDAAMLEIVDKPVAFNPDKRLFTVAQEQGWPIVIERKNMTYRLERQGAAYVLAETDA